MEKILSLFAAMILLLCGTFTVFASELGESEISQENLFASKAAYTSIVQNLNDEQIDQFFDEEVSLDLQHLVPVYIPTGDSSDNTLLNMLEFTNTYNTVVYSKNGEVLGTATLEFYENKWVVGTFYRGRTGCERSPQAQTKLYIILITLIRRNRLFWLLDRMQKHIVRSQTQKVLLVLARL